MNLIVETKKPIIFFNQSSEEETGIVEVELVNVSIDGYGDALGANYTYYGYVNGVRTKISKLPFNMDEAEMNATYAAIEGGIPEHSTYTEINLYLYSKIVINSARDKYLALNPNLKTTDFQIKQ